MTSATPDDELLSILLANLRNAAATFGEGTPPHEAIRTTIEEHLEAMKAKGQTTNLTTVRKDQTSDAQQLNENERGSATKAKPMTFANLAFRPKVSR